jgi:hypothetical protein
MILDLQKNIYKYKEPIKNIHKIYKFDKYKIYYVGREKCRLKKMGRESKKVEDYCSKVLYTYTFNYI